MFRKTALITVIIGFLLLLSACSGATVPDQADPPTELPVIPTPTTEASGIRLVADGSGDYPDLETAINKAETGETVFLEAGTYRINKVLEIEKSVAIVGAGIDETIITSSVTGAVLHFTGNGSYTLSGVTVQHEGDLPAHVVLVENGEIDFYNCRFTGSAGVVSDLNAGLMIRGSTTGTIKNCQVDHNATAGIFLIGEANVLMEGNSCKNNRELGIAFRENAGGTARDNVCNENGEAGFYMDSNGTILLEGNECSHNGNDETPGVGMLIGGEAGPTIAGNTCNANTYAGISFGQSAGGNTKNNECTFNGFAGINLEGESSPTLEGNTCNENGDADMGIGIAYFNNTGGTAKGNTVKENRRDGIFIMHDAAPELIENICSMNKKYGILYAGTQGGSAIKNQCAFNEWAGIMVSQTSVPLLKENTCHSNQAGIYIEETADPELVDNELYGNSKEDLVDLRE